MERIRSTLRLPLALTLFLCVGSRHAHAVPDDRAWADGFGWPGVSGTIYAAIWYQGELIVGGEFTEIGGTSAGLIARWDGRSWRPLGGGLVETDFSKRGIVTDLAIYDGELVATGGFDIAGGTQASNIASWNGTRWKGLGAGVNAGGQALAVYQGRLFVAGEFGFAGGLPASHVAAWDGQGWLPLTGGGVDANAFSLAVYHDELVVGGVFSHAGAIDVSSIARWNGVAWDSLGAGVSGGFQGIVSALAVEGDTLFAGGAFAFAGGQPAPRIAAWNGSQWRPLGSGMDYDVYALAIHEGALIAGGTFTLADGIPAEGIARWDGAAWSALPSRTGRVGASVTPSAFLTLAVDDTTLVAAGHFDMTPDVPAIGIARWDGHRWFPYGWGLSDQYYVAWTSSFVDYAGQLVIGGRLAHSEIAPRPSVDLRTWDGVTMDVLEPFVSAEATCEISALALYHGELIAGGTFTEIGGVPAAHIARWDGGAWHTLGEGFDGPVEALFVFDDTLVAGGSFTTSGATPLLRVARWDGVAWTGMAGGMDASVDVLSRYGGALVAGGLFSEAGGTPASHVARWDGSAWRALGTGVDNWVRALVEYDGRLIAGGRFRHAGGTDVERVAAWNGASWDALGAGMDDDVSALAVFGSNLVAGGAFQRAGGDLAACLARWDGESWSALGSGITGGFGPFRPNVLALHVRNDQLWVGGLFTQAGATPAYNLARWDSLPPPRPQPALSFALEPARPNPFQTATTLWFTLSTTTTVRGGIYDVRGRRVHEFPAAALPPGRHPLVWDGRDGDGETLPPGIYFARVDAGKASRVRKLARVP